MATGGADTGGLDGNGFPCGPNYHSLFVGPNDPRVAGGTNGVDIPGFDSIKIKQKTLEDLIVNNSITLRLSPSAFAGRAGVGDLKYLSVNLMYTNAAPIPEPSSVLLLAAGLVSLVRVLGQRKIARHVDARV